MACNACHSIDGSKQIGPTWKGLYCKTRNFEDGTSAVADNNYLTEAIIEPAELVFAYSFYLIGISSLIGSLPRSFFAMSWFILRFA